MAIDTLKLKSPPIDEQLARTIEQQCILRQGIDCKSGEVLYELTTGDLLGSWDSRIMVRVMRQDYEIRGSRCVLVDCDPYVLTEASVHKVAMGHNVFGGPVGFVQVCRDFCAVLEEVLEVELPFADNWEVRRVDWAEMYRLPKSAIKEFFDGIHLVQFPRRKKGGRKYAMAVHFSGKTTTVKLYHKGTEFREHDAARLKQYFTLLFDRVHKGEHEENKKRVERKVEAFQRLADSRLRVEVDIHADKLDYDFDHKPLVKEVSDEYLKGVHDREIERLLREGKSDMDIVRESRAVLSRLVDQYGQSSGQRLYGFWCSMTTLGDEVVRETMARTVFYRNRKDLETAGVGWLNSDVKVIANDSALPVDFVPYRSDRRLCILSARNRPEYDFNRDSLRKAA
jgi:II/X family phage/plasmid replication protein